MKRFPLILYVITACCLGFLACGRQGIFTAEKLIDGYAFSDVDRGNTGYIHLVSCDGDLAEWDAWVDWREGAESRRSVFSAKVERSSHEGSISRFNSTRAGAETLYITALPDRLFFQVRSPGKQPLMFEIPTNNSRFWMFPGPWAPPLGHVLVFDPLSWDYAFVEISTRDETHYQLTKDGKPFGTMEAREGMVTDWDVPMRATAKATSASIENRALTQLPPPRPPLTASDLAALKSFALHYDFGFPQPPEGFFWLGGESQTSVSGRYKGVWSYPSADADNKEPHKGVLEDVGKTFTVKPVLLPVFSRRPSEGFKHVALPSTPLSTMVRGEGDDASIAWLIATSTQIKGWKTRLAGGLVLRPGHDPYPVPAIWAEAQVENSVRILDEEIADGIVHRLWVSSVPPESYSGKVTLTACERSSPCPWQIVPPAADGDVWRWELLRDGAVMGRLEVTWRLGLTGPQPSVSLQYAGDVVDIPVSGNLSVSTDGGMRPLNWSTAASKVNNNTLGWLLKGWAWCPGGDDLLAAFMLYFASRDDSGWLPPLVIEDRGSAPFLVSVREAGETYVTVGENSRHVRRYRLDPPGMTALVSDWGELLELDGAVGKWRRVDLPKEDAVSRLPRKW